MARAPPRSAMLLGALSVTLTCASALNIAPVCRPPCLHLPHRPCLREVSPRSLPPTARAISRRRPTGQKRETLLAKGLAGAVLLRIAAFSRGAAFAAAMAAPLIVIAPVVAVESLLLTVLLLVTGAASYWPTNLLAMATGSVGLLGA
jgi:hypothetical protein